MGKLSSEGRQRLSDVATASRDAWETAKVHSRKLEDAVRQADQDGVSPREIAEAIRVSPTRIYAIISNAYKR